MSGGGSLINLGDLSKPATVLIEKVSDAVGGIAKPWQIERVAKAEAAAAKIKAIAQIEITDLEQRALVRMVREEGIKQENIEVITAGAIPHLRDDAKPEEIPYDWLAHFFEKSRIVSDGEMQTLWSRILAGEANMPNSFRKKTIELVSTIEKADAVLFTKLCTFLWIFEGYQAVFFFKDKTQNFDYESVTSFSDLLHLEAIGLLKFESGANFLTTVFGKRFLVHYYGRAIILEFPNETNNDLQCGNVSLTQAGQELAAICGSTERADYLDTVLAKWQRDGVVISTPIESKPFWLAGGS